MENYRYSSCFIAVAYIPIKTVNFGEFRVICCQLLKLPLKIYIRVSMKKEEIH